MKLVFGDIVENGWASADNPQRRGFVIRTGQKFGRINPGPFVELTNGKGDFWRLSIGKGNKLKKVGRCPVDLSAPPTPNHCTEGQI
jgi:hypothetical protein